jgi:AcrR family transcriptional regulator
LVAHVRVPADAVDKMAKSQAAPSRDAERSRQAILAAPDGAFAEHGFDGVSLARIAEHAGLSRAAPNYFFGSKQRLYQAVLSEVMHAREESLAAAFRPLRALAESATEVPDQHLEAAVQAAIDGYVRFLDERPTFARLISWENLRGAHDLSSTAGASTAISDAFGQLAQNAQRLGLTIFDPRLLTAAFVSLLFLPIAHQPTFARGSDFDTLDPSFRLPYQTLVRQIIVRLLTNPG